MCFVVSQGLQSPGSSKIQYWSSFLFDDSWLAERCIPICWTSLLPCWFRFGFCFLCFRFVSLLSFVFRLSRFLKTMGSCVIIQKKRVNVSEAPIKHHQRMGPKLWNLNKKNRIASVLGLLWETWWPLFWAQDGPDSQLICQIFAFMLLFSNKNQ